MHIKRIRDLLYFNIFNVSYKTYKLKIKFILFHLSAKVEIAEKNGGLGAGDDQNDEDEKEESVHVVNLTAPNGSKHEEELNKDATEGQHTSHDNSRNRLQKVELV